MTEESDKQEASSRAAKAGRGDSGQANLGLHFLISLVTAIAVVAVAAGINHAWPIFGTTSEEGGAPSVQKTPAGTPAPAGTPVPVTIDVGDNPSKGPKDAPVTIVEFSDFQCPYCARFVEQTLPQILSNYGDKVQFVFMNYPLVQLHENAQKAAEAAECAHEQGAFWQYHDLMFQNQSALDVDSLKGYAASLGLDANKFNECLDSGKYKAEVENDLRTGQKAALEAGEKGLGTPSFFINGTLFAGAQPYENFKAVIDAALAEAGQ